MSYHKTVEQYLEYCKFRKELIEYVKSISN